MELVDVYDVNRIKTGRIIGREDKVFPGEYLMIVHACIFNSDNKMLIQRRAMTKDRYPGIWDLSAGGFAISGESSLDAVVREAREELGISCSGKDFKYVLSELCSYVYDDIYIMCGQLGTADMTLQSEEISEVRFETPDNILSMIRSGEFVDYPISMMEKVFSSL